MIKIPTFAAGGVLKASDLNTLAAAVSELRGIICNKRSTVQRTVRRNGMQPLRRSGDCRSIYPTDGDAPPELRAAAGAWCENDTPPAYTDSESELLSVPETAMSEGGNVLINPHLTPARCTVDAPLDTWQASGEVTLEIGGAEQSADDDEPITLRPRRMMARLMVVSEGGAASLAAAAMWYGQPQTPVWFKHESCTRKRTILPNAMVLLPGPMQSVYLKQVPRYRRLSSNWAVDVWAWGIQARLDCHGYVIFGCVSRARGEWHSGY